ncbi:methyltransferase [uncultured Roseovarius sp.]|uniref:methyltransferase n=1 Tax=uncultured Roseovarius sp. TaxID=293344 RepID=UPI0025DA7287|nr:methyltransferase [uncultured Roseovarius sp.]
MAAPSDVPDRRRPAKGNWRGAFARLVANPTFQRFAAKFPFAGALAQRDGTEIFDILQGFVASQVLLALIELEVLQDLLHGPASAEALSRRRRIPEDRMEALLQAGAALRLLKRGRKGDFALARRGAAILGVPGLTDMIRHNTAFYKDMTDPVSILRGEGEGDTHLARFWPYVFGQSSDVPRDEAERYSDLMAKSQVLVAEDTLRAVSLRGGTTLMDVGGGSGVFVSAALRRHRHLRASLVDLPEVLPTAESRLAQAGVLERVSLHPGSFREAPLPKGADIISLIRVLYDHDDATVRDLLAKAYDALPRGGRLIISEPMAGGGRPERAGDIYFAFYTMAMGTGRTRSPDRIATLCDEAGFDRGAAPSVRRPYVTRVLTFAKPA